ncbi:MAG TPA: GNAT family N-acetyltransferase [Thermoleophilaceae bacterium]|nr:GNAT family N-acetyltransferase [Thermoleophilaceae bacterium]
MEAGLGAMDLPEAGDLDWTPEAAMDDVYRINDLAYGMDDAPFQRAGVTDAGGAVLYAARADGEIASALAVLDVDGDACVSVVGTLPQARGRGLAWRLMGCALRDARERGMTGTSLQATAAGEPVYLRLGYTIPFRFGMW